MLPIFASLARPAFAQNCTVRFNESETRRFFRFNDYFIPPELIPRSRGLSCVLRALTRRLSTEVAQQVDEVQALARVPVRVSCNGSQHSRRLVGLHVRTGWADKRLVAAPYKCEPTPEPRASAMRDELFALLLGRAFGDGVSGTPANGSATLRIVVEQIASRAASAYPSEPWTLLVTSDSPAVRASIVRRAREMGYTSVQAFGTVGHNNLGEETRRGDLARREAREAAVSAVVDLTLLARSDLLITLHLGSSFAATAARMGKCPPKAHHHWALNTRAFYNRPLVQSLFRRPDEGRAASNLTRTAMGRVECVRDCLNAGLEQLVASGNRNPYSSGGGGSHGMSHDGKSRSRTSAECRDACSCFLKAALGDGSEANLA